MPVLLWGTLLLPLIGFLVLSFTGRRLPERLSAVIGVGSVGVAALLAIATAVIYLTSLGGEPQHEVLATWIRAGDLTVDLSFSYDGLTMIMTLVVTVIGFLIHLFSVGYMHGDEGFHRYFAFLNLFVTSMLLLLVASNLLVVFVGWEMVGLCSFLLIGFWYKDPANSRAARKAFIVTRIGDAGFAVGIGLLFATLGTLDIRTIGEAATALWGSGPTPMATVIAACLLIGALGKSAQLPLHVWLPDAMAGPTPVSALIHAATMVTAGVYLIARTHLLFELAPVILEITAWIGVATILVAGLSAVVQTDLKRTLAFSTISQIGYMFLALGVGAWGAAVFHLFTHAFFKALLFLGAGAVMHATHGEQDMRKLGGLRKQIPVVFLCFLVGSSALASFPFVTDGFYSKGWILEELWRHGSMVLWGAAVAGAFVTAFYTFRMVGMVFFGAPQGKEAHRPGVSIALPLVVLALGTLVVGLLHTPTWLGGSRLFDAMLANVFGHADTTHADELLPEIYATAAALGGIVLALVLYGRGRRKQPERAGVLARYLGSGFGIDTVYNTLLVRPYEGVSHANRRDVVNLLVRAIELVNTGMHRLLAALQTGKLRWYLLGVALGGVLIIGVEILL